MAGAMRKMAVYLGLVEDDADEYGDEDHEAAPHATDAPRPPARRFEEPATAIRYSAGPADAADAYRITTLHPRTYNEAKAIGENFREGTPVIMNLTEMDDSDAKRLVDFSAGLVFGLRGSIERVTSKVFLLSPANVNVTAEDKARIAEGGFFNQS
jgi:cell division inhibitor SepF